jgi:threonine synthase
MDQVFHETGYVADPHTSVGLFCAKRLQAERYKNRENFSGQPVIVLSTAHPAKFGSDTARGKQIDLLEGTPTDFISVDNSLSDVVEIILSRAATS